MHKWEKALQRTQLFKFQYLENEGVSDFLSFAKGFLFCPLHSGEISNFYRVLETPCTVKCNFGRKSNSFPLLNSILFCVLYRKMCSQLFRMLQNPNNYSGYFMNLLMFFRLVPNNFSVSTELGTNVFVIFVYLFENL